MQGIQEWDPGMGSRLVAQAEGSLLGLVSGMSPAGQSETQIEAPPATEVFVC